MHTDLCSMRLINIKAFLGGEQMMSWGEKVDRRTKVLGFCDDEASKYTILSHRRSDATEVDFEEMVNLARLDVEESDEIRGVLATSRSSTAASKLQRMDTSGCGLRPVASISIAAWSCQRPPIRL